MTEKYAKIFERIVIGAAVFWVLAFASDLIVPWLSNYLNPSTARGGHGGGGIMIATPLCITAVVIALIVCIVKSKKKN